MHDYKYLVKFYSHLQKHGTGEVAPHLTALVTFAEDPSSILSTHMQRLQSPVTPRPGDLSQLLGSVNTHTQVHVVHVSMHMHTCPYTNTYTDF